MRIFHALNSCTLNLLCLQLTARGTLHWQLLLTQTHTDIHLIDFNCCALRQLWYASQSRTSALYSVKILLINIALACLWFVCWQSYWYGSFVVVFVENRLQMILRKAAELRVLGVIKTRMLLRLCGLECHMYNYFFIETEIKIY